MATKFSGFARIATVCALGLFAAQAWADASAVGLWKTIDDETGQVKSSVRIKESGGVLSGVVEKISDPKKQADKCNDCPGDRAGKPVLGLTIMTGMKATDAGEWGGGQILDPTKGKVYKCKIKVIDGGKKLEVRGFIGVSLLGRTQTWVRE